MNWLIILVMVAIVMWGCKRFSNYLHKEAAQVQPRHHQYDVLWPLYVVQVAILFAGTLVVAFFVDPSQFNNPFWGEGWGVVLVLVGVLFFIGALNCINSYQAKKWKTVSMVGD